MDGWTIKGEAGAQLDEFERPLVTLNPQAARLTLESLASDRLTWTTALPKSDGTGVVIPSIGQVVELFYNGERRFRGNVTVPRAGLRSVDITAEGPWWWMSRIYLTSKQTDGTGAEAERASYAFPTQDLKISLAALIDRLIANGVPMRRGTIAKCFTFPQITLSEQSGAQALSAMMAVIPDAVGYFDYSGTGLPTLNIVRRDEMPLHNLTVGTDAIEDLAISPRLDLEVAEQTVQSVSRREGDGKTRWAAETSGQPIVGKKQIFIVSGPEPNDFLPTDKYNSFDCKTVALPSGGTLFEDVEYSDTATYPVVVGALSDWILENDANAIKLNTKHPGQTFEVSNGGRHVYASTTAGSGGSAILTGRPEVYSNNPITGNYLVVSPDSVPDWAKDENGWTVDDAIIDFWWRIEKITSAPVTIPVPDWVPTAIELGAAFHFGYPRVSGSYANYYGWAGYFKGTRPCKVISESFPTLTTVNRRLDYDYVQPPEGLAENLLKTQNWVPWEGRIMMVGDTVDGAPIFSARTNVLNSLPACTTMGALTRRITYDIKRGRKTIDLGAPARLDFGSLASRFRSNRRDNIIKI